MNARFLSISLSVAAAVAMASADALAQGRGGGMSGGMGGSHGVGGTMGGAAGGMSQGIPRSNDSMQGQRPENAQGRSASQAPAAEHGKTAQDLLTQNPKLADNLSKLLPAGTDVQAAAAGFGNLGAFVSAVHVSNNLGIPFSDLKTRLLAGDSLGTAIHALKPEADAQVEVRKAQARADELTKG